jgi:hypothetical protein
MVRECERACLALKRAEDVARGMDPGIDALIRPLALLNDVAA